MIYKLYIITVVTVYYCSHCFISQSWEVVTLRNLKRQLNDANHRLKKMEQQLLEQTKARKPMKV